MERRPRSFWKSFFPRLWRRHRSEYSPRVREGRHPRINGPTSRSDNNIAYSHRALFPEFSQPKQRLGGWQPKCLADVVYEDILSGQVEHSTPNCWLEDHLHRFASIRRYRQQANYSGGRRELGRVFHVSNSDQDSMDDSEEEDEGEEYSSPQYTTIDDGALDMDVVVEAVPAFVNRVVDSAYRSVMGLTLDEQPPPYYEDPPPSYEEAVRPQNHRMASSGIFTIHDSDLLY